MDFMAIDQRPAADRAFEAARKLKPGTWESVEALATLAANCPSHPESRQVLDTAESAATRLKAGTWDSVRALAWLAKAKTAGG
jgi:hypothetical protein